MKIYIKKYFKIDFIIPVVHFLLSFIYEHYLFVFKDNFAILETKALNSIFSNRFEIVMTYIISKLMAAVLIWCIWKLFFFIIRKRIPIKTSAIFGSIFLIGLVALFFLWPTSCDNSIDNSITYVCAIRFIPEYWHSIYTGTFYAACMMIIPSPFMITAVQWLGFVYSLGYVYNRIDKGTVIKKSWKNCVFIFFLFPMVYDSIIDIYRTELYAVLCLIVFGIVVFDIIEKKKRNLVESFILALLCALLSVWRTEGLILGGLCFVVLAVWTYRDTTKRLFIRLALLVCCFIITYIPQKIGDIKYYGNDYMFVNAATPLQYILNDENANLSYEGSGDDLAAIARITPLEVLKQYGLDGYRRINVLKGSEDINQSMADKEISKEFLSAYIHIVSHNFGIYCKCQLNMLFSAIDVDYQFEMGYYTGEDNGLPEWSYNMWEVGEQAFQLSPLTMKWCMNPTRWNVETVILNVMNWYRDFCGAIRLKSCIYIYSILLLLYIAIYETIMLIKKRARNLVGLIAGILIVQYLAIAFIMPAPIPSYFRGTYFVVFLIELLYFAMRMTENCNAVGKAEEKK